VRDDGVRANLLRVFAAHLENMPELDDRAGTLRSVKATFDHKDGALLKVIILPEYHLGPAAPSAQPAPDINIPATIVRHRGGPAGAPLR
jgi:hypothetical protein